MVRNHHPFPTQAASHLSRQWQERTVLKAYEAMVLGDVAADHGDMRFALARRGVDPSFAASSSRGSSV